MPRLFTAIEIPQDVARRLSALRGGLPGARWIDPENYHLTLRFIGDIDAPLANDIAELLGHIRRAPFELAIDGLGTFGGGKPRAVFARIPASAALMALQAEQERLIRRAGMPAEERKFTPHVTLARLREARSRSVAEYLSTRGDFLATPFTVTRFVLFSSQPSRGGGPYLVEEAYPLDAAHGRAAREALA